MDYAITYEDVFQSASYGVLAVDRDGTITHINSKAQEILKLKDHPSVGDNLFKLLPLVEKPVQACLQSQEPVL